jgi:hypothetical protein
LTDEEAEDSQSTIGVLVISTEPTVEVKVADAEGRNRYMLSRSPAPHFWDGFPGHGKLHSERLVGTLSSTE